MFNRKINRYNKMSWSVLFLFILVNSIHTWKEASQCTLQTHPIEDEPKLLNIDCGSDLVYIAWAHYGHKENKINNTCYFSPRDCLVNVEYVSNECNGLSNCQVSLDSQYLHSCKSYSDYIFIIYECIKTKTTFNICDSIESKIETNDFYIQTPNYPNEYLNNLDCNCTLRTNSQIQIELFEFDLESSSNLMSSQSLKRPGTSCQKDLLTISSTQMCGTLPQFTTTLLPNQTERLNFRFKSDDALTRRGFWLKINHKFIQCPENYVLINNMCLRVYNEALTWYEANSYCSNLGLTLATIENFETEKQLNKILFDDQSKLKSFWIGMRQLNETNFFDQKNQVINFRDDEKKWWPWLVIESSSYTQGSCVAKKKGFVYLQDCYKRMPFACEYRKETSLQQNDDVQLTCGKPVDYQDYVIKNTTDMFQVINNKLLKSSFTTTTTRKIENTTRFETIILHSDDVKLEVKTDSLHNLLSSSDKSTSTSLLASLILAFLVLLILINVIVVLVILRKRKLLLKDTQNSQIIEKDSKTSNSTNHDTINSSNTSQNVDFTNEEFMQFSNTISNPSQLSYNCLANLNFNLINQPEQVHNVYNILTKYPRTMNPQRQSLFVQRNTLGANYRNQTFHVVSNQKLPINDAHVYETISVASSNNKNFVNSSNEYGEYDQFSNTTTTNDFLLANQQQQHKSAFTKIRQANTFNVNNFDLNRMRDDMLMFNQRTINRLPNEQICFNQGAIV